MHAIVLGSTLVSWCALQVTTDIPPHHFMKSRSNCEGARDIDGTTRGLGATHTVPTTSCAEENILMVDDRCVKQSVLGVAKAPHCLPAHAALPQATAQAGLSPFIMLLGAHLCVLWRLS